MTPQNAINNLWPSFIRNLEAYKKDFGIYQTGWLQNAESNFTTKRDALDQFQLQKNIPKPFYTVRVFSLFVVEIPTRIKKVV